jgi:hypothetical protein
VASFVAREYKDRETKLWTNRGAEETRLSLRGAVRDEAISGLGQGLLRGVYPELGEGLLRNKIFDLSPSFVAARHSGRATRDPESRSKNWIPACAGMTARDAPPVSAHALSGHRYGGLAMTP